MSLRTIGVQYVGKVLYLPKLEREVTLVVERDYVKGESREFRLVDDVASTSPEAESTTESLSDRTDSREKLEADVRDICWGRNIYRFDAQKRYLKEHGLDARENIVTTNYEGHVLANVIMHLLDRQAAITRRETLLENPLHNNPYVGLVRGKQWERKESSDYYCGKCGWKVTDHDSYCPECGGALHEGLENSKAEAEAYGNMTIGQLANLKIHNRMMADLLILDKLAEDYLSEQKVAPNRCGCDCLKGGCEE